MNLRDAFGRTFATLRVSVTDRCDLRCRYCVGGRSPDHVERAEILTFEEIERLVGLFASRGVRRVRLTGGEPLLRRDLTALIGALKRVGGVEEVAMTTNGMLLASQAGALRAAGLDRVNVSLDSLRAATFRRITGADGLDRVVEGIARARREGFGTLRINAVAMNGVNDMEFCDLVRFASEHGATMRFIEFMPVGIGRAAWEASYLPASEIIGRLRGVLDGRPDDLPEGPGPARYLPLKGGGEVGIIAGVSRPFCSACDRLRLTAKGGFRLCLASPLEIDLRAAIRSGASDERLGALIEDGARRKPAGAEYERSEKTMCTIGG